ncbi:MAG: creatininase family protein [Melioribacteraceae bacterium]|nr:creatininase family protein [Melioribacteraceae bacterium]
MKPRPYILKEINFKTVKETNYNVAILPWAATEAHNLHLPYGTDIYESDVIAEQSAKIAWEKGAKVVVLPAIPYGVNTQQMDIKLTINMNPSTQALVLSDVVESLQKQGIEKLVVLNGHGGNNFKQIIRELQKDSKIFITTLAWYEVGNYDDFFEIRGDHAHEMETSFMLHSFPELVLPLDEAGVGEAKNIKIKGFKEKWAWAPREWTKVTTDTGIGNPKLATAEKGKKYISFISAEIAQFLVELSEIDVSKMYV